MNLGKQAGGWGYGAAMGMDGMDGMDTDAWRLLLAGGGSYLAQQRIRSFHS
ncbi:hypothetical protein PC129_g25008 [Phytophthora cactorum]|uniref:Uncharacterized protein n=1 Tax=Phytophthora cactorum TaxID=29920 RepID=A0A8T1GXP8_9STRA|nr:hypothetical protein PC129_g25008 [Phytophthora cactorum]